MLPGPACSGTQCHLQRAVQVLHRVGGDPPALSKTQKGYAVSGAVAGAVCKQPLSDPCLAYFGGSRVEPQLCRTALACCCLRLPAASWSRSPITAIADSAATAGTRKRKAMLLWSSGCFQSRAQRALMAQVAEGPLGMAGRMNLHAGWSHLYWPYLQQHGV